MQKIEAKSVRAKQSKQALQGCWVRENGFSLKLQKIATLEQLSQGEKLFAALLRNDAQTARGLVAGDQLDESLADLSRVSTDASFAMVVLDRLINLDLINQLPMEFRTTIIQRAQREAADQKMSELGFCENLQRLTPLLPYIVWIKGSSLSCSIYKGENHRLFGDLDMVLHTSKLVEFTALLKNSNFSEIKAPAFCNQLGVGPTDSLIDLTLAPQSLLLQSSLAAFNLRDLPPIDVKLSPLDRGVQMYDLERFFSEAVSLHLGEHMFLGPSLVDHMMICLHTFAKDRFRSWKNLFDIHLLAGEISRKPQLWEYLVLCCKRESIESVAWVGLMIATDRLKTSIPPAVLDQLAPRFSLITQLFAFTISPYFVWNATSLPMMLLNAAISTDGATKFFILSKSFFPSADFISKYYNRGKPVRATQWLTLLAAHWAVLLLPGGLIRRTFGKLLWRT